MPYIIVNEKQLPAETPCVSALDRGLTLGHGLFETMLANRGALPLLHLHWDRLITSSELIGIKVPFTFSKLTDMITTLLSANALMAEKAVVRLTLTDGVAVSGILPDAPREPTMILTATAHAAPYPSAMRATVVQTRRNEHAISSRVKSISYLDNILAKKEAIAKGYDEAFLLNSKAHVADGAISNIFVVKEGVVYTPPIQDGALPGVMRHVVIRQLPLNTIKIVEKTLDTNFLLTADEMFITNALMGIMPISQLDQQLCSNEFPITRVISKQINNLLV